MCPNVVCPAEASVNQDTVSASVRLPRCYPEDSVCAPIAFCPYQGATPNYDTCECECPPGTTECSGGRPSYCDVSHGFVCDPVRGCIPAVS